ncbi:MAG: exo-alpha-sialidase [Burkholderiaceae bacterium]|jgi:hypothetical protein|nr:exo-alpha-sialidase [Burkholderiaceae bacterium]
MLTFKDLKGDAGLAEHQALHGMLTAGNEFMTHRDDTSEVRRAGEFVEMRRFPTDQKIRLVAIFESPDARALDPVSMDARYVADDEDRAGGFQALRRTNVFAATSDEQTGDGAVEEVRAFKPRFRLPRFTRIQERLNSVDHTTQSGRGRAWSLADGEHMLMVREQFDPQDPRYFMGVNRFGLSARRTRVSRVEVAKVQLETGRAREVLLSFETFSGLGFNPAGKGIVTSATAATPIYDANNVYVARAGHLWGRYTNSDFRMDPSASYAVAEPAWHPDKFLHLIAVHGTAADALDPQTSILRQLSCTRSTKDGVVRGTIALPVHPDPEYIWSAIEVDLLRTAPTKLVLRVRLGAVRAPTATGTTITGGSLTAFWSSDNAGETWQLLDLSNIGMVHGRLQIERAMMAVGDADGSALLMTSEGGLATDRDEGMIVVHRLTAAGAVTIGEIRGSVFSDGLYQGTGSGVNRMFPKYWPVASGGGVRVKVGNAWKPLLWMQFDPFFTSPRIERNGLPDPNMITYPGTNAMLMVSADGGATWERCALPTIWPNLVGFVIAADERTLLVPVVTQRALRDGSLRPAQVRLYESKDGGATWKKTRDQFRLPAYTNVDGQFDMDTDTFHIADFLNDYNRGELFPLIPFLDRRGEVLGMNPGRPWIADSRVKVPNDGQ